MDQRGYPVRRRKVKDSPSALLRLQLCRHYTLSALKFRLVSETVRKTLYRMASTSHNKDFMDSTISMSDDPTTPLLHQYKQIPQSLHCLFLTMLSLLVVGGVGVGIWLSVDRAGSDSGGAPDAPFMLVSRDAWGARPALPEAKEPIPTLPPTHIVILHTVTDQCFSADVCDQKVREIQTMHMDHFKFGDIGYNFLVGGDGRVYEGRGWDIRGAFSVLLNSKALGIAFIGDFEFTAPVPIQLAEAKKLLAESVQRNKLTSNYKLVGHRQVANTLSPGQKLYDDITNWPHWEDCFNTTC